ncbi:MAG: MFS transporter [Candidatus Lokiarchaeota archaeon]|nr:MFS transporter [Candidatus Lokiarchaeota archaeon]
MEDENFKHKLEITTDEEMNEVLKNYGLNQKSLMFALFLSILVDVLGFTLTLPLLPTIADYFGASKFMVGIIISANSFTSLIFGPIWGKLSDKYGRRPILIISQAGTFVAFIILALAEGPYGIYIVIGARLLDGVFGGQLPIIRAIISDITTPYTRPDKMAKVMAGVSLGALAGPLIGGISGEYNWKLPPLITAGLSLASILITLKVLKETMPAKRREDLNQAKERIPQALRNKFFTKELVLRLFQTFFFNAIIVMFNSSSPLVIAERYGGGPMTIGLLTAGMILLMVFFAIVVFRPLRRKFGIKYLILFAVGVAIIAFLYFPVMEKLWMISIFLPFYTIYMSFARPIINVNTMKAVDATRQGEVSGWATTTQSIAQTLFPLISTGILQIGGLTIGEFSINSYWTLGIVAALTGVVLLILLIRDIRKYPKVFEKEPVSEKKPFEISL